jgi:flagellar basal-body rod protein FlgG
MGYSLFQALNISRQDMLNRLLHLDVISNNLANMNTAGFKVSRPNFQELLALETRDGTALTGSQILTQQGAIRTSQRSLDWAIEGEGFFQVRMPNGETGYTRDGQFNLDADRNLVNASGYPLVWDGEIPEDVVDIALLPDGTVQGLNAAGEREEIGSIELARFTNPTGLIAQGNNTFIVSENSGEPQVGAPGDENFGYVKTHAFEQSNMNAAEEMTNMMSLQRAFQMSVRAFQQSDAMIGQAIHMRKA